MPTYEYQCATCGHCLEAFQKMSDEPLKDCPECHKATLQKLISAAGFQLKGTGWYATDFRNKPANAKGTTQSTDTGSDAGSSSTQTSSDSNTSSNKSANTSSSSDAGKS